MSIVKFSILSYYPSFITNENINIGILFELPEVKEAFFHYLKKWDRIASFDDELNLNFFKDYLRGISDEVSTSISNYHKVFVIEEYIKFFVNEYKFSKIQLIDVDEPYEFIDQTKKVYLRFDFDKSERLTKTQEYNYISKLLRINSIAYKRGKILGQYNEKIKFDYTIGNYVVKLLTFEGKNLSYLISTAKLWAYNAWELKDKYKTIFIYDKEMKDSEYFDIIVNILKESAYKIMIFNEGIDFLTSLKNSNNYAINV
jgi:hypothetical protein